MLLGYLMQKAQNLQKMCLDLITFLDIGESDPISAVSLGTQIGFGWFTGYKHAGKSLLLSSANGKGVHNHSSRHNLFDAFYTRSSFGKYTTQRGVERARDAKDSAVHAMSSTVSKIKNSVVNAASSLYNWAWGKSKSKSNIISKDFIN